MALAGEHFDGSKPRIEKRDTYLYGILYEIYEYYKDDKEGLGEAIGQLFLDKKFKELGYTNADVQSTLELVKANTSPTVWGGSDFNTPEETVH